MDLDQPIPKKKAAASSQQPEKKKRGSTKRKKSTGSSSNVDLSKLLPFVSRGNLEGIITASIRNDLPPNVADIIATLPESDRWRFTSSGQQKKRWKSVESGPERVNTGLFNQIDNSTMANIMGYLPSKDCHTVVSSVCKGWRELKTSIPSLFIDLSDSSWDYEEPGSGYRSKKSMKASTLSSLLDWVPNLVAVTGVRISTQDKCNPNTCKQIVKKLGAALPDTGSKKKKNSGKKKNLSKLVLHGPKIYGSLMGELVRQETGAGLKTIEFSQVKQTQSTKLEGSVADFFRTCSQLEEIYMPQALATAGTLRASLTSPLMSARAGSATLLRVLDLSSSGYNSFAEQQMTVRDIATLGRVAPELEVLKLVAVSGVPTGTEPDIIHMLWPAFLAQPIESLPRLKEFSLGRIIKDFCYRTAPKYASTENVNSFLTWLLAGMPAVEKFSFGHGRSSMTRKDESTFSYPDLPGIGDVIWPTSLKYLRLRNLSLESSAFENAGLPSLETLKLSSCGTNMGSIIDSLGRSHPDVEASDESRNYRDRW